MVAIKEERARNAALTDAVEAADASTKLVDTLYRAGLTNFQNVLDMQRTLTAQQDALAESNGNLGRNATLLYKALGGGWDPGATTTTTSKK
jgi:multidrug efflux system outer membrane protein